MDSITSGAPMPLDLIRPDGVAAQLPDSCAWLLTRPIPKPRLVPIPNGKYAPIGKLRKDGTPGRKMLFDYVPDPDFQHQPVRVIADGWAYWREGGEIMCEPLPKANLRTLAEEAA